MARREAVSGPGMEDEEAFRRSMRSLRESRGWTQADLAKRMTDSGWSGVYQTTISRLEKGERPIRIGEARGIAAVFGVTVGLMIAPTEEREPIEELRSTVVAFQDSFNSLAEEAQRFTFWRMLVGEHLKLAEKVDFESWADEDLAREIRGLLARAKAQQSWTIQQAIDAGHEQDGEHPEDT